MSSKDSDTTALIRAILEDFDDADGDDLRQTLERLIPNDPTGRLARLLAELERRGLLPEREPDALPAAPPPAQPGARTR